MKRVHVYVGILTKYLKQIKNLIFFEIRKDCGSFKIYKDRDVNEFFWCICILGGILRSKKVGKTLKISWLIYHIFSACLLVNYNIYAFVHTTENNLTTVLMLLRPISLVWVFIGTYVVSFLFYKSLEKYTDELDKYLSTSLQQGHDQNVSKSQFLHMLVILLYFVVFSCIAIPLFFPFANALEAKSKALYLIFLMAKFTSAFPCVIIPYCGLRMRAVYVKKFLQTGEEFKNQIKSFSIATSQNLELAHEQEMIVQNDTIIPEEREYHLNLLTRRKNAIYVNVDENIAYFAKQHQKLFRINMYIKAFFETACSIVISYECVLQIIVGIDILQIIEGHTQVDIRTVTRFLFLLLLTFTMNEDCDMITMVEDGVQGLCYEVYSIPWYLLPTKQRKMIALLLTQCQHTPKFLIFGMYPFGAPLVPQVLNLGYSYISVLRVIMLKKSK